MKNIRTKILFLFVCLNIFGCAGFYIHGSNPVKRAVSAAELLIEGRVSDGFIRAFNTESAKAELFIADMIEKAKRNDLFYAEIADSVDDWVLFYRQVGILERRYPGGLTGKNETAVFKSMDYTAFREEAFVKAADALFRHALNIKNESGSDTVRAVKALPYLKRSKKYSSHLDTETSRLGAEICFSAAESFAFSDNPEKQVRAADFFEQADSWLRGYKNSAERAFTARKKAVELYLEEGKRAESFNNYSAFRQAKAAFAKAENILRGSALKELSRINKKLTIRLAVIFKGSSPLYPDENGVRRAVEEEIALSVSGPDNADIRFIREDNSLSFLFAENYRADLVLVPAENFGKIREVYGSVDTTHIPVSKTVDGITYMGSITEQSQRVTVFFQNDYLLFDTRGWRKKELAVFQNESFKTSKTFTQRLYSGSPLAKPDGFQTGGLYISGQYDMFFPGFAYRNGNFAILTRRFSTLNDTGKKLCRIIENLYYE